MLVSPAVFKELKQMHAQAYCLLFHVQKEGRFIFQIAKNSIKVSEKHLNITLAD